MFMIYKATNTKGGLQFVSFEGTTDALVLREVEDYIKSSESFKNAEHGDLYFATERSLETRIAAQWAVVATVELVRTDFEKYLAKSPESDSPEGGRFGVD